jgi:MscS family membrane protein
MQTSWFTLPLLQGATGSLNIFEAFSISRLLYAALILLVTYFLIRLTQGLLEKFSVRSPRSRFLFKLVGSVARFSFWLIGLFIVLFWVFAPTRETTLAVLASVGIAIGFGAQDLVKNLIGGIVILMDRPYQMGDRVKIGDAYGEVDHIGLRSTKITTADDTRVTIPNSEVLTGMVWNANSGTPPCLVVTELYLPHHSDPVLAKQIGLEAAYSSPYVLVQKPVAAMVFDGFQNQPFLKVVIKAYAYDHRVERQLQSDVTIRAKAGFSSQGLGFPRDWYGKQSERTAKPQRPPSS